MKYLRNLFLLLLIIIICFGSLMFWKAWKSQKMKPELGHFEGQLKACGDKPNCVSSFAEPGKQSYIEPIKSNNIEVIWDDLNILLPELKFVIVQADEKYIHAIHSTPLMKFADDVEFLLDQEKGIISMRSESRVGYSDLGTNRKRLNKIRDLLLKK